MTEMTDTTTLQGFLDQYHAFAKQVEAADRTMSIARERKKRAEDARDLWARRVIAAMPHDPAYASELLRMSERLPVQLAK